MWSASAPLRRHEPAAPAAHLRAHAEEVGGRALRVEVPHEHAHAGAAGLEGEVDRGARLPDAALDAVGRDDLHAVADLVEQRVEGLAVGLAVVGGEPLDEGGPLLGAAALELVAEPAHGEQRVGVDRRPLVQVVGEVAELGQVHLGVLVLAEVVLEVLELADERLALARSGSSDAEALEQVAELLGVLAQVVQALAGRVGRDGPPVGEHLVLGLLDAVGDDRPEALARVGRRRSGRPATRASRRASLGTSSLAQDLGQLGVGGRRAAARSRAAPCSRPGSPVSPSGAM